VLAVPINDSTLAIFAVNVFVTSALTKVASPVTSNVPVTLALPATSKSLKP